MSNPAVNLVWLGVPAVATPWELGEVLVVEPTPFALAALLAEHLPSSQAKAWLFWDAHLPLPTTELILTTLTLPGNVWHAGLKLGMRGQPLILASVTPTWMLNSSLDVGRLGTSWRLSLRACLIQTEVLRQMGSVDANFLTLEAAALEMGHRYITHGVIPRYVPSLLPDDFPIQSDASIPYEDQLRFVVCGYNRWQHYWSAFRSLLRRIITPWALFKVWRRVMTSPRPMPPAPFVHKHLAVPSSDVLTNARVTVLIPTLYRYPYLRVLLDQLRTQTIRPLEIIVIDQTKGEERDLQFEHEFSDLPLKVIVLDEAGQCISRNAGLNIAQGDYVLFVDDDDEIQPDLIERHLRNLHQFRADASCGSVIEVGGEALSAENTFLKVSAVFPTNNTLVRRDMLKRSGLFDLAYNRMSRADSDLGMRVYLAGGLLIYNPAIQLLHHHAPQGGLRVHKARVITRASSRQQLMARHLSGVSDIYRGLRYFGKSETREMMWMSILTTFRIRGGWLRQVFKVLFALMMLPDSIYQVRRNYAKAEQMLKDYPQIPQINDQPQS